MIAIKRNGGCPTNTLSTEKQLLFAAWAYGLKSGDQIHRFDLYSFIYSHLANKNEENLQKSLETDSINWKMDGYGLYSLTSNGHREISSYGIPNSVIRIGSSYIFSRNIDSNLKISIQVNPQSPSLIPEINGISAKSMDVIAEIKSHTSSKIPTGKTSIPRKILNWILQEGNYTWEII